MDEPINDMLPPTCLPASTRPKPIVIGGPMAWLVLLDDTEDLLQHPIASDKGVTQQGLDLAVTAFLGQRNDSTHALKQIVPLGDL